VDGAEEEREDEVEDNEEDEGAIADWRAASDAEKTESILHSISVRLAKRLANS
jgi:hypothetical protein